MDESRIEAVIPARKSRFDNRLSPFRYPGGKAFLYNHILKCVERMRSDQLGYVEPYAGGAGAALMLLAAGKVTHVTLNDADRCVYAAWNAILRSPERFVDALMTRAVNLQTWQQCKEILHDPDKVTDEFEVGFATFFLNRTNRSGILRGAGPIGGYSQLGKWKIDARYYADTISRRILQLSKLQHRISLHNMDGLAFLQKCSVELDATQTFYFIDPPYVQAGSRLYLNTMTTESHKELGAFLGGNSVRNWLLTYDDCELTRETYRNLGSQLIEVPYSLQKKRKENELVVERLCDL